MPKIYLLNAQLYKSRKTNLDTLKIKVANLETHIPSKFYINKHNILDYSDFTQPNFLLEDGTSFSLSDIHKYGERAKNGDVEILFAALLLKTYPNKWPEFIIKQLNYYENRYNEGRFGKITPCIQRFISLYLFNFKYKTIGGIEYAIVNRIDEAIEVFEGDLEFRRGTRLDGSRYNYPVGRSVWSRYNYFAILRIFVDEQYFRNHDVA